MLGKLLLDEINERRLSIRAAARQIGIAHTTLQRVLRDNPTDLKTIKAIGEWLKIDIPTALGMKEDQFTNINAKLNIIFQRIPALADMLEEIFEEFDAGVIPISEIEEVIKYTTFRLTLKKQIPHE